MKARKQSPKRLPRRVEQSMLQDIAKGLDRAHKLIEATWLHRELPPLIVDAVFRELLIEVNASLGQARSLAERN